MCYASNPYRSWPKAREVRHPAGTAITSAEGPVPGYEDLVQAFKNHEVAYNLGEDRTINVGDMPRLRSG